MQKPISSSTTHVMRKRDSTLFMLPNVSASHPTMARMAPTKSGASFITSRVTSSSTERRTMRFMFRRDEYEISSAYLLRERGGRVGG